MLPNNFRTLKLTLVVFSVFYVNTITQLHAEEVVVDTVAEVTTTKAADPVAAVSESADIQANEGEPAGDEVSAQTTAAALTDDNSAIDDQSLNEQVQSLKEQVLKLNKDLFILEEELLYPSETQLAVYVSLDIGHYFTLDAVKLSLDGEVVSSYLYTDRQVDALKRGGIQRLYMGNIRSGEHELVAVFTGLGPNGEDYRRASELTFSKDDDVKNIELKIVDSTAIQQPEFIVKEW